MPLHVETRGEGPPLLLLHGFTQTGRLWGEFGEHLTSQRTLLAPDLPGHAGSDAIRADLPTTAAMVAEAVRSLLGSQPFDVLGYSLGARVGLHLVTTTELAVSRLVLIGGTAGLEDPEARERRRRSDEAVADRLERSGDVARFLSEWLAGPMFARLAPLAADRSERLRNSAAGLASSLRLCGLGTQLPLWERLDDNGCPILALAGTDDPRFAAHAVRIARQARRAVASLVPGGGHAVHLAQPGSTSRLVTAWLQDAPPRRP